MAKKYVSTYDRINHSKRNSIIVVIGFILFFAVIFALIGFFYGQSVYYYDDYYDLILTGLIGSSLGILVALIISMISYRNSGKILAKAADAVLVDRERSPALYEMVDAIAAGAQINSPRVYIIESGELNAFASGSGGGKSMIAVTRGLLETLSREELEGVVAHEVAHLKNNDIKFVSLAAALSAALLMILQTFGRSMRFSGSGRRSGSRSSGGRGNAIVMLVVMALSIIAIVIGPLIVRAMQSAVSKQREFLADANGAAIIGYPLGLASALEKIDKHNRSYLERHQTAFANRSVHALCISQPLTKKASGIFATHPPISERVERLRAM